MGIRTEVPAQQGLVAEKEGSAERGKTWQVYCLGNRNVFRLDMKESREGLTGRRRTFHGEESKKKTAWESTVESLVRGT